MCLANLHYALLTRLATAAPAEVVGAAVSRDAVPLMSRPGAIPSAREPTALANGLLTVGRLLDPRGPALWSTVAGAATVVALTFLSWLIGVHVQDADGLALADEPALGWLIGQRTEELTLAMRTATVLGSVTAVIVIGALAQLLVAWWSRRPWPLIATTVALVGAGIIVRTIKALVGRARPPASGELVSANGLSFPSGHTVGATVVFGVLGYFAFRLVQRRLLRGLAVCAAAALIVLVGISRMYLGVHWLTDVVAGWTIGGAWLAACLTVLNLALPPGRAPC